MAPGVGEPLDPAVPTPNGTELPLTGCGSSPCTPGFPFSGCSCGTQCISLRETDEKTQLISQPQSGASPLLFSSRTFLRCNRV